MNPEATNSPTWKVCKTFNSALLEDEKEGERLNEILCANADEAECLVALLNNLDQEITKKTNEVARLREELDRLKRGCQGSCYACEPVGEMNLKLEAEVARLREELKERIETQSTFALALLEKPEREVARLRELLENILDAVPANYREQYEQIIK